MSRSAAVAVICAFAAAFCLVSYLAFQDIGRFEALIAACADSATLDYSSLWMGGFVCFLALPLLVLSGSVLWHRLTMAAMIALFFAVPFVLHGRVVDLARERGYATQDEPGLLHLGEVTFRDPSCGS